MKSNLFNGGMAAESPVKIEDVIQNKNGDYIIVYTVRDEYLWGKEKPTDMDLDNFHDSLLS